MIFTSSYTAVPPSFEWTKIYSISGDRGAEAGYMGPCYPKLAPKMSFWQLWHDGISKVPSRVNDQFYIEEYWKQVLSKLDASEVYKELDGPMTVLLCYEPSTEFCHRHIVSAWFELMLGETVAEIKQSGPNEFETADRPLWIKEYLEELIGGHSSGKAD